jgi:hypothetical protein
VAKNCGRSGAERAGRGCPDEEERGAVMAAEGVAAARERPGGKGKQRGRGGTAAMAAARERRRVSGAGVGGEAEM